MPMIVLLVFLRRFLGLARHPSIDEEIGHSNAVQHQGVMLGRFLHGLMLPLLRFGTK